MKIGFEIIKLCEIQKLCLPLVGATVGVHDGLEVVGDKLGFDVVGVKLGTQIKFFCNIILWTLFSQRFD